MTDFARFMRQVRLAEVGEEGQARLVRAEVRLENDGTAGEVEGRYLRGAGVRTSDGMPAAQRGDVAWLADLTPAAREVAQGAHAALGAIRAILRGVPHPRVR